MLSAGTTILCQRSVEHDDEDPEKYFEAACEEQAEKEQTFAELLQDDAADFEDSQLHLDSNFLHSFAVLLPLLETSSAGSSEASALTPHFLFSIAFSERMLHRRSSFYTDCIYMIMCVCLRCQSFLSQCFF